MCELCGQILCTLGVPAPEDRCDHDFELDEYGGTDYYGSCLKCGMSFLRHVHMEMP